MNPSSTSRRQTSCLSFEVGTSSRSCLARWAFLILVKRSEIGSVMLIEILLALTFSYQRTSVYQLALVTPGRYPWSARSRR